MSRLILIFCLVAARAMAALDVGQAVWGFDGKVVEHTFNLLSVEVRNPGPGAFDGDLTLDAGEMGRAFAPYKQRVFLAPGTVRMVQFFPYFGSYTPEMRLHWKASGSEGQVKVNSPKPGVPATVFLADPEAPGMQALRLKVFPEMLFPATAAGTDGLHAVVLDHVPRWDAVRRDAFLDWVKRGGIVHLLPGPDGAPVVFGEELGALNVEGEKGAVGAGLVVKHKVPRAEVTETYLAEAGFRTPEYRGEQEYGYREGDSQFFGLLAGVTKPNIAWGLIYLLTAVYVVIVGPVFFLQRKRDYRVQLVAFFLTVGLFAWLFTVIGRRGYGEKQIHHSVGLARSLGEGRWDVQQWVHAFATSGDTYRFTHAGPSQLYGALGEGDTVRATVEQGREGAIVADIPLFSSRPFVHRGILSGPDLGLKVAVLDFKAGNTALTALRIEAGPQAPDNALKVAAQYKDKFYAMKRNGPAWEMSGEWGGTPGGAFGGGDDNQHQYGRYGSPDAVTALANLQNMGGPLVNRVTFEESGTRRRLTSLAPREGVVRVFIYAPAPAAFHLKNEQFQSGTSYILFVVDLPAKP